ncbi:MAG TPA: alpha/beta hydrolase [Oceanospirillaceae bacterium]|nr:alpha/beta hydrolase [Oceanospirillaceae bacterium]
MYIQVNGQQTFVATGGKPFDKNLPCVVLLHGSGLDHRCWALQARWFAFHGYSVFAPDLPGHSLSSGEPLTSIEAMGTWLVDALDAGGVNEIHIMGHSQGYLMALEAAPILGDRLLSLMALATAAAIPVNPALIDTAKADTSKAADMMLQWGFGSDHQYGVSAVPGMQPIGIGQRIMANNPLAIDLEACNNYVTGNDRAAQLSCPVHVVLAEQDRMTPKREGMKLAKLLGVNPTIIAGTGHMLPMEAPKTSLQAMKSFIQTLN